MKVPLSLLRDMVVTTMNADEIGDLLTMAGIEVESVDEIEDDWVLDIKVVSNRGDALSAFGLAREILAKDESAQPTDLYCRASGRFRCPDEESKEVGERTQVAIETPHCTRFAVRLFENVSDGESPAWMQKRLTLAGMRPLSLLVDISNYVMLELGQPNHAYDQDRLAEGRLVARQAQSGEILTTLNGDEHQLNPDQMVIADAAKPVGVAGVMGGLDSEVSAATKTVLLEAAHFVSNSVRRTRKQLGLSTEASYRFERSVDPEGVVGALNRFKELLEECDPSVRSVPGVLDVFPGQQPKRKIHLRMSRCVRLLGMDVLAQQAKAYLERLGCEVIGDGEPFEVEVPTWRPDLVREDDLVEEVGRVHGFELIPDELPIGATTQGGLNQRATSIARLRDLLLRLGFDQVVSHTLCAAHPLDSSHERIGPRTPGSPDIALLRNSICPALAEAAKRNGAADLHLFEVGKCFWRVHEEYVEQDTLGLLSIGKVYPDHRAKSPIPAADFFTMKGVLEALGVHGFAVPAHPDPRLHPTRQAEITGVGVFGVIHPDAAEAAGLPGGVVLAELALDPLLAMITQEPAYQQISRNPAIRRDIAVLAPKSLPYSQIVNALELSCGDVLEDHWLFDIYEGQNIPSGKHSLGIAIVMRKMGENFTDEEANQVREKAVAALEALGATRR